MEQFLRIAHPIEPLFQLASTEARIGSSPIEVLHQNLLGEKRKVSDRDFGQLLFADAVTGIIVPIKS
jgi:hypothetical protein